MDITYQIKVVATGEVRDADGNLVESIPIETTRIVTESELARLTDGEPT